MSKDQFISNEEFYTAIGIDDVKTKLLMGCIPQWLLGPVGYALFIFIAVIVKFRKPIIAFVVGGAKAARKSFHKKNKKNKSKNKKKHKNNY